MADERVAAIRGAITIDADTASEISARVGELLDELWRRNDVDTERVIAVFFTATPDISSMFPAQAAREWGLARTPLLGSSELDVEGALGGCIRVMVQLYTHRPPADLQHAYLRGATVLRPDVG